MVKFDLLPPCKQSPINLTPFANWRSVEGEVLVEFYRTVEGYTIRFLGCADFLLPPQANWVIALPEPGTLEQAVKDLYYYQILPMICGQRGDLVIHASGVAAPSGALGFVASTGRGKSTLAAGFARSGVPFLSDDGLTLVREGKKYTAHANRPSFRLWHDSEAALGLRNAERNPAGGKVRIGAAPTLPFHDATVPLCALYFLGAGQTAITSIEPLSKQRAMAALINHSFLLDVTMEKRLRLHFEQLGELAETVPCYTLDYPREYAALSLVIDTVLQHAFESGQR